MREEFSNFIKEFIEHPPKDGPDLSILDSLSNSEKNEAIKLLIEKINLQDIYAIQALSYLKAKDAVPKLKRNFLSAKGYTKVYLCEALWNIEKFKPALEELCAIATKDSLFKEVIGKERAIIFLGEIKEHLSEQTLLKLITHKESNIRLLALRSLAKILEMQDELHKLDESIIMPYEYRQKITKEIESILIDRISARSNVS